VKRRHAAQVLSLAALLAACGRYGDERGRLRLTFGDAC
jgi:hypothetical protein